MLNPQIVVKLLPELGVGVDLVKHGNWLIWNVHLYSPPLSRLPSSGVGSLHGGTGFCVSLGCTILSGVGGHCLDLPVGVSAHPLSGASRLFLAASQRLGGWQQKLLAEMVWPFLGRPDHSARIDCDVLHALRSRLVCLVQSRNSREVCY
jgi:hypothetical protein